MGLSKSTRITILLVIDTIFFLVELFVGYRVHSLALVADSFHMLNDVLSLCVGLWAVKVSTRNTDPKMYTYGWQRAETLGALINGVFLLALCMSIFLEAISRFFEPQEVSSPQLVGLVGCFGLSSNIFGLALFHEHGHNHGDHQGENPEEGRAVGVSNGAHVSMHERVSDEGGNAADTLPENIIGRRPSVRSTIDSGASSNRPTKDGSTSAHQANKADEEDPTAPHPTPPIPITDSSMPNSMRKSGKPSRHLRHSGSRPGSAANIPIYPPLFRNSFIEEASRLESEAVMDDGEGERLPLLAEHDGSAMGIIPSTANNSAKLGAQHNLRHEGHNHAQPKKGKNDGKGHDLNMRGIFLHVMGDALGNLGVIASALIIGLWDSPWRFYSDPAISLMITVIILASAIPLCKAASRILLQAVPVGMDLDDIKDDILRISGIWNCHHLHLWQLSGTKLVATLHIKVDNERDYLEIMRDVRQCLHGYGIHSSTIQPEPDGSEACLFECGDECDERGQCCVPSSVEDDK